MNAAIDIQGLTKTYGDKTVVQNVTFLVQEGELLALLGVNAAGKTTLIKMLSCLTPPTGGDAFLLGHSILTEPQKVKEIISVSPQETAVAPNLTVLENLQLMAGAHGLSHEAEQKKLSALLPAFSLGEVQSQRAKSLSGGYSRRLSIAMALMSDPKILFLDEPTLGLDILARRQLWQVIRALKAKTTILLTTHYLEEAEALADRVCILKSGVLCAMGTAAELMAKAQASNFEEAFVTLAERKKD